MTGWRGACRTRVGTAVLMVNSSLPVHQRAQTADPIPRGSISTAVWLFHRAWGHHREGASGGSMHAMQTGPTPARHQPKSPTARGKSRAPSTAYSLQGPPEQLRAVGEEDGLPCQGGILRQRLDDRRGCRKGRIEKRLRAADGALGAGQPRLAPVPLRPEYATTIQSANALTVRSLICRRCSCHCLLLLC